MQNGGNGHASSALRLLEERLVQHDNNRKDVQSQLDGICSDKLSLADSLEEEASREIHSTFDRTEERILTLINKLNNSKEGDDLGLLVKQAHEEFAFEQKYEINCDEWAKSSSSSCGLTVINVKKTGHDNGSNAGGDDKEEVDTLVSNLQEHLEKVHNSMVAAQDKVMEICARRKGEVDELKKRINEKLKELFTKEDARLQEAVNLLRENIDNESPKVVALAEAKARTALVLNQKYALNKPANECSLDSYDIIVTKETSLECFIHEGAKPSDLVATFTDDSEISLSFAFFSSEELDALKSFDFTVGAVIDIWAEGCEQSLGEYEMELGLGTTNRICFTHAVAPSTTYCLKVRLESRGASSGWSDCTAFTTPDFRTCAWRRCPDGIESHAKYSVDEKNPRILSTTEEDHYDFSTVVGTVPLPPNAVATWSTRILKSRNNGEGSIYVGVAPFDINRGASDNLRKCGWYFHCLDLKLWSGPPHNYAEERYSLWRLLKRSTHAGDRVGVTVDTSLGTLSFSVNRKNYGVAYEGIPLDKPLVPCVILERRPGNSVELIAPDITGVNDAVDSSVPVPSSVTSETITWDTISLTWDNVNGASFYQIEVGGSKFWGASKTNTFAKRGLLPGREYDFRVRAVRGCSVSEWSDVVKGRTQKRTFGASWWKECPAHVPLKRMYIVDDENPRIVTKINNGNYAYCTIIGSIPIPLNTVTSWSIKILKSQWDNSKYIFVGIAPFDIDQDDGWNKCGWYFDCYFSKLYSGPPHNYSFKEYGPRKERGQYVHTGDSVGVLMDTIKGELSFVLDGVNFGVAYCGIPLDKPLVPCVLLGHQGDSVELGTSEVKENVDSSVPVPSNITTKSRYWGSIELTWNRVIDASFYQIEVDGSKSWDASTIYAFTKRGLLPETEHNFRVRTVKGSSASAWSGVVKGRTQKRTFETSWWKECPARVSSKRMYVVDEENPRIATKINDNIGSYCTIIGNTPIPLNTVASWSIKILKSQWGDSNYIFVGVVPFDIDQDDDNEFERGWYFYCYYSSLYSGPPHKYDDKEYGPRKYIGQYVRTGDSVGVVVDTAKGELSFVLNGVNLGVAYEGIPLDKPLVPCVLLRYKVDSVEIMI